MDPQKPNIIYLFADQLRASSLPVYGENQIETPHIDRLVAEGTTFTNMISTCPVCTPYRSMLVTGRHPQTTDHILNFVDTRHDEIGIGDAFAHAGYQTAWIGKWHLHTGSFPQIGGADYVPEGRDRLGFQYWRGYNFHMDYFNGAINLEDWRCERWEGYETNALNRYTFEYLDQIEKDKPFCLFISPHQPHMTPFKSAPSEIYDQLPEQLKLPDNVPEDQLETSQAAYRDYLAMTLTVEDMLGELLVYLDESNLAENTILIFTSDHGTQMGAHGWPAYKKKVPYEESLLVPMIARWPSHFNSGSTCDSLASPVDIFPTLCGLCDVPIPRTVEGIDLSDAWLGKPNASRQEAVLTMNFLAPYDYLVDGEEWRGVRTLTHHFATWLDGTVELYNIQDDPLQKVNLFGQANDICSKMGGHLQRLQSSRNDKLLPASSYANWFDSQRRIIRNAHGPLGDPESPPDWSLLS